MSSFDFRLLVGGAGVVLMIGWAGSWWLGVIAGALYTIAASVILRPVVQRWREAHKRAKRELRTPKDWQGQALEENPGDNPARRRHRS